MKLTPRDRVLLGVLGAVLLAFGFYKFLITPEHRTAAHLQAQIGTAQTALAKAQQEEADGHADEVALRASQGDWTAAQHAVPEVADIPALLKLLQRSAAAAHVSMQSISLSGADTSASTSPASTSSAGGAPAATPGATSTGPSVTEIPVALSFTGGYQALNRLVARLDSFVTVSHRHLRDTGALIGIGSVVVSPTPTGSSKSSLSVQLTASLYQRSAASTAAGASTGSAG